jgi:hypothetical protein
MSFYNAASMNDYPNIGGGWTAVDRTYGMFARFFQVLSLQFLYPIQILELYILKLLQQMLEQDLFLSIILQVEITQHLLLV